MESAVANLDMQTCPTCGTELARAKFLEVQRKLREHEDERAKKATAEAVRQANLVLSIERKRLSEQQAAVVEKARATEDALKTKMAQQEELLRETTAKLTAGKAEFEKNMADAVASARQQAEAEALKNSSEQRRLLEVTKKALEQTIAAKAAAEKASAQLREQAVAEALKAKEEQWLKEKNDQLARVRELDRAENDKKLIKERSDHLREREGLLKTVEALKRKVEAKTSNDLGDGAEIDLYDALKAEFDPKGDNITRVPKGQPGADIVHHVLYNKAACGKILIDSKNRQAWQNAYTTKLAEDMVAEKADYAVLASIVFPKDEKDLCLRDNVIVVQPARLVPLVRILRQALVRIHQQKVGNQQKDEKKAQLYALLASEPFRRNFDQAAKLATTLLDIDVEETAAHKKVWMKRGNALKNIERLIGSMDEQISNIIDGTSNE
jgi:hypothetical protein